MFLDDLPAAALRLGDDARAHGSGNRLPAAWWLGVHLEMGLVGIWLALSGELAIRAAMFIARFYHGGWKKIRL